MAHVFRSSRSWIRQNLIESMESRVFLSSTSTIVADLEALKTAATAANANVKSVQTTTNADAKAIKKAVTTSKPIKVQKQELAAVQKQMTTALSAYKKDVKLSFGSATRDGNRVVSALKFLKTHETLSALSKVTADFAALQAVFSTAALASIESAGSTLVTSVDADLDNFAMAVPAAQSGVTTAEAHLAAEQTTLLSNLTALQSAVTTLGNDLP